MEPFDRDGEAGGASGGLARGERWEPDAADGRVRDDTHRECVVNDKIQARLEELRTEYARGRETLEDLETQVANVRATMMRISGAIQVLEELTEEAPPAVESADPAPHSNGGAALAAAR
jgi:uncharacterized coiled-coil protein SlyX